MYISPDAIIRVTNKLLPGILFLLLAVFSAPPRCLAVTIVEIYDDEAGEGFLDETELTQAQKTSLAALGNDADTVGEARKNAFEHAASILENRLADAGTIRISVKFEIFDGQHDPDDQSKCGEIQGIFTAAYARPTDGAYPRDRLVKGDAADPGFGTGYPLALYETMYGENLNGENADIEIVFSRCIQFYYGLTEPAPANHINFVRISLHEIMHGLGFSVLINGSGVFPLVEITGEGMQQSAMIRSRTIYDEQLYSERDNDLLIDLSDAERAAAITSGTGLLWEGTDGGRNSCSYAKRVAERKPSSAKSRDGKPRLHASSTYNRLSSVVHTHANTEDIMEPFAPFSENMDLALGMLKDMGWSIKAPGFPSSCGPSGTGGNNPAPPPPPTPPTPPPPPPPPAVTVSFGSSSYSVTEGEETDVEVMLSADPERTVTIPITIDRETTAADEDYSLPESVTFASGETSKDITLAAADDEIDDDGEVVVLAFGTLPQGVSGGVPLSTTVTIADPVPPVDPAEGSGGGCSVAARADHGTGSAAACLLAAIAVLLPAFLRKSRLTG